MPRCFSDVPCARWQTPAAADTWAAPISVRRLTQRHLPPAARATRLAGRHAANNSLAGENPSSRRRSIIRGDWALFLWVFFGRGHPVSHPCQGANVTGSLVTGLLSTKGWDGSGPSSMAASVVPASELWRMQSGCKSRSRREAAVGSVCRLSFANKDPASNASPQGGGT